ncbi:MAG TPA: hypothetical protein VFC61_10260, partial [Blastocatellia bacterium]|nr:hypothetical protein [Blastocatellia bacterium]
MIIPRIHTKPRTRQGLMWLLVGVLLMTSAPTVRAKGTTAARASAGGLGLQAGLLAPLPVPAGPAPAARAQANTAQDANQDYNSSTGPSYVLPGWGNLPWAAPQYYTTIQLGDLDGDGKDELIGREGDGITVHKFDPVRGQWQPVLNADGTILRGPLPDKDGWDQPQYYLTIQLADVDGKPGKELVARGGGGMLVYRFTSATPKPGSTLPAGAWQPLTSSGPFADSGGWSGDPSYYTTIQLGDIDGQPGAELIGRGGDGLAVYKWDGMGWTPLTGLPALNNPNGFTQESYYKTIQLADVDGQPGEELLFRELDGMRTYKYQHGANGGSWIHLTRGSQPFGDSGYGFDSPSKYWTIQTADIDRDGVAELLGRGQYGV